jgi:putative membrane protein
MEHMKTLKLALAAAAAFGLVGSTVAAQAPSFTDKSRTTGATSTIAASTVDKNFIEDAAQTNLKEIKLAELALQKSGSADVKTFAQRMIDDHTAAQTSLSNVAQGLGVTLPTTVNAEGQQAYDHMQKLSGNKFDTTYMDAMVAGHNKVARKMQHMEAKLSDKSLKDWNVNTLKTVHTHIQLAQKTDMAVDMANAQAAGKATKKSGSAGGHY